MSYFYIIESVNGRVGFGITSNPIERNKQYAAHSGDIIKFKYIYSGLKSHAHALEQIIKNQWFDDLWWIEDWKTEWLLKDIKIDDFHNRVHQLIIDRHLKLKLIVTDFDFTQSTNFKDLLLTMTKKNSII